MSYTTCAFWLPAPPASSVSTLRPGCFIAAMDVIGLDKMSPYYDVSLKEARLGRLKGRNGFHFIKADLAEREVVEAVFAAERPERVIHLAAQAGVRYSL